MSREAFPGRASLSFAATDGILDIDQILSTNPWTEIDDYVQRNFMQNILNDFNERMALDPKRIPTDTATRQEKSPRRNAGKNRNTVEMESNDPSAAGDGNGNITSTKVTDATANEETPRDEGNASDAKERIGPATRGSKGEKGKSTKSLKKRKDLENPSKPSSKQKETVANNPPSRTSRRQTRSMAKSDLVDNETEAAIHRTEATIEEPNTPGHSNTLSPIKASTPKRDFAKSPIRKSAEKGETIEGKRKVMATIGKGVATSETVALTDREINYRPGFLEKGHGKTLLRGKRPEKPVCHVSGRKYPERCPKSAKVEKKSDPNKKAKKAIRKLEKGRCEGEEKRRDRKNRQRQRKAAVAFEKLGLQVNSIVARMGYLPAKGRRSRHNTRDRSTDSDTSESSDLPYSSDSSSSISLCSCFCSSSHSYSCSSSSSCSSDDSHSTLGSYSGCCCGRGCVPSSSSEYSSTE